MKLKMKLLAAAVALMAAAGANASMDTSPSLNGSSLILVVGSKSLNLSGAFDLGYDVAQFQPGALGVAGTNVQWDLSLGTITPNATAMGGGLAALTGNYSASWAALAGASDLQFGVIGYSVSAPLKNMVITASVAGQGLVAGTTSTQFGNMQTAFNNYLNPNNALGTHATDANGASTATSGSAYAYQTLGSTLKVAATTWSFADAIGTSLNFNQITNAGKSVFASANPGGPATFRFDTTGVLTYNVAAVPEPETYGMLSAGLLMLGAIARRRKSA